MEFPALDDEGQGEVLNDVEKHGWHFQHTAAHPRWDQPGLRKGGECPGYSCTVGVFYSFGHPEVLIIGLPREEAHAMLTAAVREIAGGRALPGLLGRYRVRSHPIPAAQYGRYFGTALWFYENLPDLFPAIQILWADEAGVYPGASHFAHPMRQFLA